MFDDEALEEKSCFTNNGKIKYTLMTLIINWCIIPVFRSFYIKYGEKNTGSQFVTQYFLILFFA